MTMLNGQIAFSLEQDLTVAEQETIDDDLIEEAYRQRGILLLKANVEDGLFQRTIEEFLLADEVLNAVQGQEAVDFEQLDIFHGEATAERQVVFPFIGGLEIESDLANSDVAMPPAPSVTPYEFPDDPVPIPAFALHWPTVTPVLSQEEIKLGEAWQGSILVQIGAGQFPLSYSVKLVEYVDNDPLIQISLAEQERVAMAGDIALHLKPRGTWNVRISHEDGLWREGKGQMTFSVRARYKEDEEDEDEIDLEVLKWQNKFTVERIPVTFDDNKIYPIAWKAKPSIPEAEKSPLPPKQDRGAKSWWKTTGKSE